MSIEGSASADDAWASNVSVIAPINAPAAAVWASVRDLGGSGCEVTWSSRFDARGMFVGAHLCG